MGKRHVLIINKHFSTHLGGSETQCHMIAEGLSGIGNQVTYLAIGGAKDDFRCNYEILEVEDKPKALLQALTEIKPEIVYWRRNKKHFPVVADWLDHSGIPLIFSSSNAYDLRPFRLRIPQDLSLLEKAKKIRRQMIQGLQHYRALKKVSFFVCNNVEHLDWVRTKRKMYIPNSPYIEKKDYSEHNGHILWVGNLKFHKRPDLFIDLANQINGSNKFFMIGGMEDITYKPMLDSLKNSKHFKYFGKLSSQDTNGIIEQSSFIVHTGGPEGFPNTFLQAWSFGKPVLSLGFDPGGIINANGLGYCVQSIVELKEKALKLIEDKETYNTFSENALMFVQENFNRSQNIDRLNGVIQNLCGS